MRISTIAFTLVLFLTLTNRSEAQDVSTEIAELRQLLDQVRNDYEIRIAQLENRLTAAERQAGSARRTADDAVEIAEQSAIDLATGSRAPNTFNPALGAVLVARYADIDRGWDFIPGFLPGGEIGPGDSGFSLGESEVNLKASVDAGFFGNLTLALEDEGGETEVAVEEAWIQTTALAGGVTLRGGRYFSGIGYLNGFHRHADDFGDRPLPYQAFLGGQYRPDGAQIRWIAPTSTFVELGGELNWGSAFPASGRAESAPDGYSLFAKIGSDIGASHSWQAGASYLSVDALDRSGGEADTFTGDSDLIGVDFVWKWAPKGNSTSRSLKLQAEYFHREEQGRFAGFAVDGSQDGWYMQAVWRLKPAWRIGYRHDQVSSSNGIRFDATALADPASDPKRDTLMLDWSPSEFSRLRFQYTNDDVLAESDSQILLQYLMSIGAHGAHQF